ncbi:response regulator [Amphibiibacter pelophylacis]|uniref:Winged helix-turn-helix domain-containing protein n=1 Tax=Amphibiibacter pelophylacis TaxID=1799477 RepID=A0ACC6P0J3_9BURK
MATILVVDDELAIAQMLSTQLRLAGHTVQVSHDARSAQAQIATQMPDLVVLDWMMPGESGLDMLRRWRRDAGQPRLREMPVILLTARAEESDIVTALEAGADDYLTKPFSSRELQARIRSVLRRHQPRALGDTVDVGALSLDPESRLLWIDPAGEAVPGLDPEGRSPVRAPVQLGPTEFKLLHFLMTHPDRSFTRGQLLDHVWGDEVYIEERTVDVHIKRLREALADWAVARLRIQTVRGVGYRFAWTLPQEVSEPRGDPVRHDA